MWRLTHDQKYRDWGWDAIQVCQKKKLAFDEFLIAIFKLSGIREALSNRWRL